MRSTMKRVYTTWTIFVLVLLSVSESAYAQAGVKTQTGAFADGATFLIEVPANWNGTLLLYSHGYVPPGSTNPVWFLRIGRALSRIVLQTSRALPLLVVTSTTLVNIEALLSLVGVERESRECRSHSETKLLRLATKLRPPPIPVNDRK